MPSATKAPKRVVRHKAKGPIDPALGQRVRALRTARGLSQAQIAGPDFSKGFISLVETGRTRISLRSAEIIARRLGVSASDLVGAGGSTSQRELEFLVLRAEQELAAGRHAVASEAAASLERRVSGALRARVKRVRARALIETDRSRDAVRLLDEARREFEQLGEKDLAARTLVDLARAHARLDQPGEALHYLLASERALEAREVVDRTLELQVQRMLSNVYVRMRDFVAADLRAERALAIAQDVSDPDALAKLYSGLALTRQEQGDTETAIGYARKSLDLYEQLNRQVAVAETWNTLGWLYVQRGHYGKATEALGRAESLARAARSDSLLGWITSTRADLALARGNLDEAIELADGLIESKATSAPLRAAATLARAEAVARTKAPVAKLRAAFEAAIKAAASESAGQRARVHQAFADALSKRDHPTDAFAHARTALELLKPSLN